MQTRPPLVIAVNDKGAPLELELTVRESETAPGRLKVGMVIPTAGGISGRDESGVQHEMEQKPPGKLPPKIPTCVEFRLEMN